MRPSGQEKDTWKPRYSCHAGPSRLLEVCERVRFGSWGPNAYGSGALDRGPRPGNSPTPTATQDKSRFTSVSPTIQFHNTAPAPVIHASRTHVLLDLRERRSSRSGLCGACPARFAHAPGTTHTDDGTDGEMDHHIARVEICADGGCLDNSRSCAAGRSWWVLL